MDPYFARFEKSIDVAADLFDTARPAEGVSEANQANLANEPNDSEGERSVQQDDNNERAGGDDEPAKAKTTAVQPVPRGAQKQYSLIEARHIGYTAILLFARDATRIHSVQEAEVGFGAADMGNKGAVALRILYGDTEYDSTELTFVATHLAAMEWNLPKRNENWASIMKNMAFENPMKILNAAKGRTSEDDGGDEDNAGDESSRLLDNQVVIDDEELQEKFHNISVFKPTSHLFVGGDLNYRISTTSPQPDSPFPNMDEESADYYPAFFCMDQLTREKSHGRTLHGMTEHPVHFPPTYKYVIESGKVNKANKLEPIPWKFATHRYPSWTDRILYLDIPSWVNDESDEELSMDVRAYDAMPVIRTSDHRPVFLRIGVPALTPEQMMSGQDSESLDPRVKPPVEIDPHAWERRSAARDREMALGWSTFLWGTTEGAIILGSLLVAGLGGFWLYQHYQG